MYGFYSFVLQYNKNKTRNLMNYIKLHDAIINKAVSRKSDIKGYKERHHIKPRSMGGDDSACNLVYLTAREHFIIHWLLKKIHNNKPMVYAFFAMTKMGNSSQERYTSRSFKYAREAMSNFLSNSRSGENHPLFGLRGKSNPNFGSKRSDKNKANMSKAAKGIRVGTNNHKSRQVKNLSTGEIFGSIRQAQLSTVGNVSYAVRTGGTAGGHKYCYIDKSGNELPQKSTLKGYAKGKNHYLSVAVRNTTTNEVFQSIGSAARSIGKSSAGIIAAIDKKRSICGYIFERVEE